MIKKYIILLGVLAVTGLFFAGHSTADKLARRWENAFKKELKQAVAMFEKGDSIGKPQLYELGRSYILRELHSRLDLQLKRREITRSEHAVLKAVFSVLSHCNPPGGCDLSTVPGIVSKKPKVSQRASRSGKPNRTAVKEFLTANANNMGLATSVIGFLTGTPYTWKAFSKRILNPQPGSTWQEEAKSLAGQSNKVLTKAAKLFGLGVEDFANTVPPPAVRVNFINRAGTPSQPRPKDIVNAIKAYEGFGETYGNHGWQGIVKKFLDQKKKESKNATLQDFSDYLQTNNVLLKEVDLGNHASDPAASASEKLLNSFFTDTSIFLVV